MSMFKVIPSGRKFSVVTYMGSPVDKLMVQASNVSTPHTNTTRASAEDTCAKLNRWYDSQQVKRRTG